MEVPNNELSDKNKKHLPFRDYEKEVAVRLKQFVFIILNKSDLRLCKTLYNKYYSISDTTSLILMKH